MLLILCEVSGFGQGIGISGVVLDAFGKPLTGANIVIENTYDGAATDAKGVFLFTTKERGPLRIKAQLLGFEEQSQVVTLTDTTPPLRLDFKLNETASLLQSVTVKARLADFLARSNTFVLHSIDIKAMGGSNTDIANAFRTMPGVQPVTNETGLLVRGGTGDETKVFIDGLQAPSFFYNGSPDVSQRGRFSPDLFAGNNFSSGGYSAQYGQALSSSLMLETTSIPVRSSFGASLSPIGVSGDVNILLRPEKQAISGRLSYTNMHPYYQLVPQRYAFSKGPAYLDGMVHYKQRFANGGQLKAMLTLGQNDADFTTATADSARQAQFGLTSKSAYANVHYEQVVGGLRLSAGLSASKIYNLYSLDTIVAAIPRPTLFKTVHTDSYQGRFVLQRTLGQRADFYAGAEFFWYDNSYKYQRQDNQSYTRTLQYNYAALFTESNWLLTNRLSLKAGLRYEYTNQSNEGHLSPRLALNYSLKAQQKLFANYGQFYQLQSNDWLLKLPTMPLQKATHYIAGYLYESVQQIFRAEVYHKTYQHLAQDLPQLQANGYGYARGIEFFWKDRKTLPELEYWVSYSFIDTKRLQGSYPVLAQPNFAAQHVASLVTKRFISPLSTNIGLTYTFASGRTYYNPNRPLTEALTDRTTAYHNVGLTIAHLSNWFNGNSILALSVNNLLGSQQVFGYQYGQVDPTLRTAITPLARRFYFIGLFMNWGIDRRQKTLNDLNF